MRGVYTASCEITSLSAAKTLMYVTAASTHALEILEAHVTNATNNTAAQLACLLQRITSVGTPTATDLKGASPTQVCPEDVGDQASAVTACKGNVTASEPTYGGAVLDRQAVNNLGGYHFVPLPEDRPTVPPSGSIGLYLATAPTSGTFEVEITWREIG